MVVTTDEVSSSESDLEAALKCFYAALMYYCALLHGVEVRSHCEPRRLTDWTKSFRAL